jgi:hypothetical protein
MNFKKELFILISIFSITACVHAGVVNHPQQQQQQLAALAVGTSEIDLKKAQLQKQLQQTKKKLAAVNVLIEKTLGEAKKLPKGKLPKKPFPGARSRPLELSPAEQRLNRRYHDLAGQQAWLQREIRGLERTLLALETTGQIPVQEEIELGEYFTEQLAPKESEFVQELPEKSVTQEIEEEFFPVSEYPGLEEPFQIIEPSGEEVHYPEQKKRWWKPW